MGNGYAYTKLLFTLIQSHSDQQERAQQFQEGAQTIQEGTHHFQEGAQPFQERIQSVQEGAQTFQVRAQQFQEGDPEQDALPNYEETCGYISMRKPSAPQLDQE